MPAHEPRFDFNRFKQAGPVRTGQLQRLVAGGRWEPALRLLDMTPEKRLAICRNVLAIAKRRDDEVLALEVLKRYPTRERLQLGELLLGEPKLRAAAQSTIHVIKGKIGKPPRDKAGQR